jgi:hypothetical protein
MAEQTKISGRWWIFGREREHHFGSLILDQPMLVRAEQRIRAQGAASVQTYQSDLRALFFAENSFDCMKTT